MKRRKVECELRNGHQQQNDLFLLLHDNCWIPEDTLFPNGVSTCSERWIRPSICDGSLQRDYFCKKDSATQALVPSCGEEAMLFNDLDVLSWGENDAESIFKEQPMLPHSNSNCSATLAMEGSPIGGSTIGDTVKEGAKEVPLVPLVPDVLSADNEGYIRLFFCNFCGNAYKQEMELMTHMAVHADILPFTCNACNKKFECWDEFESHMSVHIKQFTCHVCNKRFKYKSELKSHLTHHHSNLMLFSCEVCRKSFKRKQGLTRHMAVHSDIKPYACQVCKKKFKRKYDMDKHMRVHRDIDLTSSDSGNISKTSSG